MRTISKASESSVEFFKTVVPDDLRVTVRPMFGNISAFVNGNMFMGIYGEDLFVRIPIEDRGELLKIKGASVFEPMKGMAMKEYIVVPRAWKKEQEMKSIHQWISKSLGWAGKLPPKQKKKSAKAVAPKKR